MTTDRSPLAVGAERHLSLISIVVIIVAVSFRGLGLLINQFTINNQTTAVLVVGALLTLVLLRQRATLAAARITLAYGIISMFLVDLSHPEGLIVAFAGYIMGILLSAILINDRTWQITLLASMLLTVLASGLMADNPDNILPRGYFTITVIAQLVFLVLPAVLVGQFYNQISAALGETRAAHDALSRSERQTRLLMDLAADGFVLHTTDGQARRGTERR